MNELNSLLRAAGHMMLDYQSPKVFSKGHHADFVTEADIAVQFYLVDALQRAYPRAKFLAEEEERHVLTDALTFIIDPIDGTTNYFRRRRCSMISIGAVEINFPFSAGCTTRTWTKCTSLNAARARPATASASACRTRRWTRR